MSRRSFWLLIVVCVLAVLVGPAVADDWPQWLGPRRDAIWRERGILETFPAQGPHIRWRTPIGAGYAGPAVAAGKVYVTDRVLVKGVTNPNNAFAQTAVAGSERVLCLDEKTGKVVWTHEYDCQYRVSYPLGPRTTPVVDGNRVYTLGTMGHLFCLNTESGKVIWSKHFPTDYSAPVQTWGFSAHPLLDGDKLICLVGGNDSVVVAFDKMNGNEIWRALYAKEQGYCPPMIFDAGGKRQLIIWHPESVNALNPETGSRYWSIPFRVRSALTIPTPRKQGDRLLATSFYNGSMLLQLDRTKPAATVAWKGKSNRETSDQTDGLHSIMATPFIRDNYIYGVCSYGQLRCLKVDTGERVWESFEATGGVEQRWGLAFIIAHEDRYFLFNEKGDLISARLTPQGYTELGRAHIVDPSNRMPGRLVVWSHPAFAHRSIYARNDREIVCASLAAD